MAGSNRRTSLSDVGITHLELSEEGGGTLSLELGGELGRGGSCIVYEAKVAGGGLTAGQSKVVKEFCPEGLDVDRLPDGSLEVGEGSREEFGLRLERFARGLKRFGEAFELKGSEGSITLPRPDFVGEAKGTIYSVSDPWKGVPLSACDVESVHDVAREMTEVCRELGALHRAGLLYLDCKPSNLWRYETPDGEAHVALFDFDTVEKVSDLRGDAPPKCSSWTHGWAPPEQTDRRRIKEMGPATDVYAVGATFLWLLTGLRATSDVAGVATGDYGLDWWGEARESVRAWLGANPHVAGDTLDLVDEVARGTLAEDPAKRVGLPELEGLLKEIASNSLTDPSLANELRAVRLDLTDQIEKAAQKGSETARDEGEKTREFSARATAQAESRLEKVIEDSSARKFFSSKKVIISTVGCILLLFVIVSVASGVGSSFFQMLIGGSRTYTGGIDSPGVLMFPWAILLFIALVLVALVVVLVAGAIAKARYSAVDAATGGTAQIDSTIDEHMLLRLDNANHQYEMGLENWRRLDYSRADSDIKAARDEISAQVAQSEVEVAKVNNSLGSLYLDMGKYQEAYDYLNAAYVTFRDTYGESSLEARAVLFNIAEYDYYTGDFDTALKDLQTVANLSGFQSEKSILTGIGRLRAMIYDARGEYADAVGQYGEVLQLYSDAVQDGNVVAGLKGYANDPSLTQEEKDRCTKDFLCVAQVYSDMAEMYIHQKDYASALASAKTGLTICLDNVYIGKKNLVTSRLYKNLAQAESMQGSSSQALDDIDLAMRIQLNLFDFEGIYPGLVEVYDAYGIILRSSGKSGEASAYFEKAISLSVESFGENHPQTANACRYVGEFKAGQGSYGDAAGYFRRGIEARRNMLGESHPDTALLYVDLAEVEILSGDAAAAGESARTALGICESLGVGGELRVRAEAVAAQAQGQ